jgi:hypothetical protein
MVRTLGCPIVNIEITDPFPEVLARARNAGCALVVRRNGKPFWFLLPEEVAKDGVQETLTRLRAAQVKDVHPADADHEEITARIPLNDPPTVTAVICTRDRPDRLKRCLTSLTNISFPGEFPSAHLEILVVDNAPRNNDAETVVRAYPPVRYICEKKPGLDFARNRAWKEARGQVIAYLDDDVVADLRRQYYTWGMSFMAFVSKTYRTVPMDRRKLRGLVGWWMRYQTSLLLRGLGGRKEFRPDLVLAEVAGGAVGLCGEYQRSLRRLQKIRGRV